MVKKECNSRLRVRVTPGAVHNELVSYESRVLRVKIAALPVKGKANKELIIFLSEILGVKNSQVSLVRGEASRDKVVAIDGLSQEQIEQKLFIITSQPG